MGPIDLFLFGLGLIVATACDVGPAPVRAGLRADGLTGRGP